jgi:spore germination cell wall hydrolase CwlJ-like protein
LINFVRACDETRALLGDFFSEGHIGLIGAAVVGGASGLFLGGAYLAGGMAQAAVQHDQVFRVASAARGALSEDALVRAASQMSPGALAVARRHDPFTVAGAAERDRQAAVLAARLEQTQHVGQRRPLILRASFGGPFNPAAAPFRLGGALDASRDLDCLTQAVYYEARGESASGQAAVAQVVLNRVRHPAFPKSVCGVVFQGAGTGAGCQFSFACDGSMRGRREHGAWERARDVADRALNGAVVAAVGQATHFHTVQVSPPWGSRMLRVAQMGLHIFYRFGGRAGSAGAFTGEPEPSSPEALTRPIYASAGAAESSTADGHSDVVYMASAVTPKADVPAAGVGGPTGPLVEPASAPGQSVRQMEPVRTAPSAHAATPPA